MKYEVVDRSEMPTGGRSRKWDFLRGLTRESVVKIPVEEVSRRSVVTQAASAATAQYEGRRYHVSRRGNFYWVWWD